MSKWLVKTNGEFMIHEADQTVFAGVVSVVRPTAVIIRKAEEKVLAVFSKNIKDTATQLDMEAILRESKTEKDAVEKFVKDFSSDKKVLEGATASDNEPRRSVLSEEEKEKLEKGLKSESSEASEKKADDEDAKKVDEEAEAKAKAEAEEAEKKATEEASKKAAEEAKKNKNK